MEESEGCLRSLGIDAIHRAAAAPRVSAESLRSFVGSRWVGSIHAVHFKYLSRLAVGNGY